MTCEVLWSWMVIGTGKKWVHRVVLLHKKRILGISWTQEWLVFQSASHRSSSIDHLQTSLPHLETRPIASQKNDPNDRVEIFSLRELAIMFRFVWWGTTDGRLPQKFHQAFIPFLSLGRKFYRLWLEQRSEQGGYLHRWKNQPSVSVTIL